MQTIMPSGWRPSVTPRSTPTKAAKRNGLLPAFPSNKDCRIPRREAPTSGIQRLLRTLMGT